VNNANISVASGEENRTHQEPSTAVIPNIIALFVSEYNCHKKTFGRQGKMQRYEGKVHSKETHHPTLPCTGSAFLSKSRPAPFADLVAHVRRPMRLHKTDF
jgi:hypothetical protein